MTPAEANELFNQVEVIERTCSTIASKSLELKRVIVDPFDGDFCNLLLSLIHSTPPASEAQIKKVLTHGEDCDAAVTSLCNSGKLSDILMDVNALNHDSLKLKIVEYFTLGIAKSSVPLRNLQLMVEFAADCLPKDDQLALAERSTMFLHRLVTKLSVDQHLPLLQTIYNSGAVHKGKNHSVVFMRYLSFFSKLCNDGSGGGGTIFTICSSLGAVRDTIELCQSQDVLLQMTALELLVDFADSTAGLDHLSSADVISWLIAASCGSGPDVDAPAAAAAGSDPLIASQTMRILGEIFNKAALRGYDLTRHVPSDSVMHFVRSVYNAIEEGEEAEKLAGARRNSCLWCLCL